ncbi:MAG: LysR family transcriptional regulator [Blautia obeum]
MYRYACRITNEIDTLENMAAHGMTKWIRVSLNPSSWFANQFVDFYNETYEKNYHFQLTTAGVRSVMDRVRDYVDDIGFVYILSQQKENFLHEISRNKLQFVPMYETDVVFYPGKETELYDSSKSKVELKDLDGVRFIQNYQDEFFDIGSVHEESFQWKDIDISVLTNSDYIMEKMLKNSRVSNVSGSYLSENKTGTTPGIPLNMGDSKVLFGYIVHKGEKINESVQELIDFWWHDYIKVKTDLFHNAREIFFFRIAHNPPRGLCAFF